MSQWQVRATSDRDAVMTFGLSAPDKALAVIKALERLPWPPKIFSVDPVPPPPGQGSPSYAEHQQHAERHHGCRFCV